MYFDVEFLMTLSDDWIYAIGNIATRFNRFINRFGPESPESLKILQEVQLLLQVFCRKNRLGERPPALTGTLHNIIEAYKTFLEVLCANAKKHIERQSEVERLKHYKNVFEIALENAFHYEFSEGDLELIQKLINELRKLISTTEELQEEHKQRLLSKLEKVQSELHKKVSDLDRFWGCCVDLSIVIGLMGKNAEPAADLVKKIVAIIWPAQARAYELPSTLPFKLLGQSEDEKSENGKS